MSRKKVRTDTPPSANGANGGGAGGAGRGPGGRFAPGNPGGPGNPHAAHVGRLRSALLSAVGPEDLDAIARKLVKLARAGEMPAIRELLDRTLGRPTEADLIERLEALEELAGKVEARHGTGGTGGYR